MANGGYPHTPFSRQSLSNPPSPPSPLFIRWGLDLFSIPLSQSLGTRLIIDSEGKPSPSKFWYGSRAFAQNKGWLRPPIFRVRHVFSDYA